jgi:predicted nucleic acid-binding protein
VLIELLNHYAAQGNFWRNQAASFVAELIQHSQVELVIHGRGMLIATLEFYHKRQDKGYSFTDCLSMLIMRDRGITQVLTDDKHFRQEGFQTLL